MPVQRPQKDIGLKIYDQYVIPDWVPEGISWDELTKLEQQRILDAYRFSGFRPTQYQTISGSLRAVL